MGIVYANGSQEITVAASDKISATAIGPFKVYKRIGYPNFPGSWELQDSVDAAPYTYTSAAVSAETVFRIDAGASDVSYQSGTAALASIQFIEQAAPTTANAAGTLTVGALFGGIITVTQATGATIAITLPTGASIDAGADVATGQAFDWSVMNLSAAAADTATVTANTGHTIVGEPVVQASHATTGEIYGAAGIFRTRKTAADTFVTYRIG